MVVRGGGGGGGGEWWLWLACVLTVFWRND
jgi:hypothetical protein